MKSISVPDEIHNYLFDKRNTKASSIPAVIQALIEENNKMNEIINSTLF